jgi:hypothetical protein
LYPGKADGIPSDVSVFGSALVRLGEYDATCTLRVDHTGDEIESFLSDDFTAPVAPTPGNSTGGFQGTFYLALDFPNEKPSVRAIIESFLGEVADASGLNSFSRNIPTQLLSILDSNELEVLEIQMQNDTTTGNKWQITFLHVTANLEGLDDILNLLPGASFEIPVLDIFIHSPSDPVSLNVSLSISCHWPKAPLAVFQWLIGDFKNHLNRLTVINLVIDNQVLSGITR